MDVYIGTIMPWSVIFAPKGWKFCDGSILPIAGNEALYSLIGDQYGGDGRTNFALPDLRGRAPIGTGHESTLWIVRGTALGYENQTVVLDETNLPPHTHTLNDQTVAVGQRSTSIAYYGTSDYGSNDIPQTGSYLGAATEVSGRKTNLYRGTLSSSVELSGVTGTVGAIETEIEGEVSDAGQSQAFSVSRTQPSLAINYIIAVEGLYPPRP